MATFEDSAWSTPESDLEAGAFCSCCLIDTNPAGQEKVKSMCWLPIKKRPGAAINKNALRNAGSRIFQMKGVPDAEKRKAAKRLVSLMGQAGIEVTSQSLLRLAGKK